MRMQRANGLLASVSMPALVATLLWLGLVSADPITESVVITEEAQVGQELRDFLSIMQEDASVAAEPDVPEARSWFETASRVDGGLEARGSDSWNSRPMFGERTAKVFSSSEVTGRSP